MNRDVLQGVDTAAYERKARAWDRWMTILIVVALFVPLPFARFESWPTGTVITERLITPWSRFRICYVAIPDESPVEEVYNFTWTGKLRNPAGPDPLVIGVSAADTPLLKWQNAPEVPLRAVYLKGDFLRVKTLWQPLIFWPFRMMWRTAGQQPL